MAKTLNINPDSIDPQFSDIDRRFRDNKRGDIKITEDAQAIQDSLINIFRTRKNERKHRPNFGTNLAHLKHELAGPAFGTRVREVIRDGFSQEPRARLQDLTVEVSPDEHVALIQIVWNSPILIEEQKLELLLRDDS